jgi:hypothetical protein
MSEEAEAVVAPLVRDVGRWSARPRLWRITTATRGESQAAIGVGSRLPELESAAAKLASRSTTESRMSFFCLPDALKAEGASLDPASLLRPDGEDGSRRFVQHFAEYLEFLGLGPELSARACIVAAKEVSPALVRPFAERTDLGDTVVCCNLSEVEACVALRARPTEAAGRDPARAEGERETDDAIAVSLEVGDGLIGLRSSILGYVPDERGEPTCWFEGLVLNGSARLR